MDDRVLKSRKAKDAPGLPTMSPAIEKRRRAVARSGPFLANLFLVFSFILSALVGAGVTYVLVAKSAAATPPTAKGTTETTTTKATADSSKEKEQVLALQTQISTLQAQKQNLQRQLDNRGSDKKIEQQDARIQRLVKYKEKVHRQIQEYSLHRIREKYGDGPHYVAITVSYDPASNLYDKQPNGENVGKIIIQLANENDMPHTVLWFLDQVDRQLYDGASFHRNAGHVLQAGPTPNFLTPTLRQKPGQQKADRSMQQKFTDTGLDHVMFQEYSPKFPHVKYTLGYAGRPGGPDFYISTQDNTKAHGPGGQGSYEDPSEADPCFAKIVEGFDVVEHMRKAKVQPGNYKRMENYVAIVSMRKVLWLPPAGETKQ